MWALDRVGNDLGVRFAAAAMPAFFDPPTAVGSSEFRVQLTYWWRHRRLAQLRKPRLFTEWVQHRKLNDRDPRLPMLADKLRAKLFVATQLGADWVTPTLWKGASLPEVPAWDYPYVVKSRHGCGHTVIVWSREDHDEAVRQSRRWMRQSYGAWLDEWLYGEIDRGLLVEPYIGEGRALPIDYKVFLFGGQAQFVQVHLGRGGKHRWIVFDPRWRRVSPATQDADPARPTSLHEMLQAAERLAQGFCFVRADFYEVGARPRFGELTFYPGSGLERVEPPCLDLLMGRLWSAALPLRLEPASSLAA
jgi:hypothetical protein